MSYMTLEPWYFHKITSVNAGPPVILYDMYRFKMQPFKDMNVRMVRRPRPGGDGNLFSNQLLVHLSGNPHITKRRIHDNRRHVIDGNLAPLVKKRERKVLNIRKKAKNPITLCVLNRDNHALFFDVFKVCLGNVRSRDRARA